MLWNLCKIRRKFHAKEEFCSFSIFSFAWIILKVKILTVKVFGRYNLIENKSNTRHVWNFSHFLLLYLYLFAL